MKKIIVCALLVLSSLLCSCTCKHPNLSEATCTTPSVCHECGEILSPALGHIEINDAEILPTCTEAGLTEGSHCFTCGLIFTEQKSISALGHTYKDSVIKEATCSENGTKEFVCEQCQHKYTESVSFPVYTADQIYEMSKKSVAEITVCDKQGKEISFGTGFVYKKDGQILTNFHVIDSAYSLKVDLDNKTYTVKSVLAYDRDRDLAVLKIDASDLTPLPICYDDHSVGKTIYALGSSRGLTDTFSQGIITYSARELDGVVYVQHDAAISGGNSGGPLINEYGEVIGINTMTIRDSQNLNFAVSVNELKGLSYRSPLSVKEFYNKECNPFMKLKNHIISEGDYSTRYEEYYIELGYSYSNDYTSEYTRVIYYDPAEDSISLYMFTNFGSNLYIEMDEFNGIYEWGYYDDDDYDMAGTLYAATFTSNTLLGYSYQNIYNASLRSAIRELASAMVHHLCSYMDTDLANLGLCAEDLGFNHY